MDNLRDELVSEVRSSRTCYEDMGFISEYIFLLTVSTTAVLVLVFGLSCGECKCVGIHVV